MALSSASPLVGEAAGAKRKRVRGRDLALSRLVLPGLILARLVLPRSFTQLKSASLVCVLLPHEGREEETSFSKGRYEYLDHPDDLLAVSRCPRTHPHGCG